jgi:DNA-binding PadR family transcriptional regulator
MCEKHYCWHDYPERGWVQFLILRILYEKPMHGYRLMEELEKRSFGCHKLKTGSIYTLLRRMEKKGLISSAWETVEVDRIEESTKLQGLVKRFFEEVYKLLSVGRLLLMI